MHETPGRVASRGFRLLGRGQAAPPPVAQSRRSTERVRKARLGEPYSEVVVVLDVVVVVVLRVVGASDDVVVELVVVLTTGQTPSPTGLSALNFPGALMNL